jgi:hypothetical protein
MLTSIQVTGLHRSIGCSIMRLGSFWLNAVAFSYIIYHYTTIMLLTERLHTARAMSCAVRLRSLTRGVVPFRHESIHWRCLFLNDWL